MTINIQGTNFDLTGPIKEKLTQKVTAALGKFRSQVTHVDLEVEKTTRHHQKGELFRAEANVEVPGRLIRSEATHEDLYAAIEELKDKLERELRKTKGKKEARQRREGAKARFAKTIFFWRGKSEEDPADQEEAE